MALVALLLWLPRLHAHQALAHALAPRADVSTTAQLYIALADAAVGEVLLRHGGAFTFMAADFPAPLVLDNRQLLMRGQWGTNGRATYVDANHMTMLLRVANGGVLLQERLYLDRCLLPHAPLCCFAYASAGGHVHVRSSTLADSSCADIQHSTAARWLMHSAAAAPGGLNATQLDSRSFLFHDITTLSGMIAGSTWRFTNVTLACTGNPAAGPAAALEASSLAAWTWAASLAAVLAGTLCWVWLQRRERARVADELPEVTAARARGIHLLELIGRGAYGKVYRARCAGRGRRAVAVKVLQFPAHERERARRVAAECQISTHRGLHPNVLNCFHHSTVTVRRWLVPAEQEARVVEGHVERSAGDESQYWDILHLIPAVGTAQAMCPLPSSRSLPLSLSSLAVAAACGVRRALSGSGSGHSSGHRSMRDGGQVSTAGSGGSEEPQDMLMTFLLMDYCSGGTLQSRIESGAFENEEGRGFKEDWVVLTALDVARGLQHLHEARQLVHRDLSTSNVLLQPDPSDPRGFRALLSDFGLSVALSQRHHTGTAARGTVQYMPPDAFQGDAPPISPALDVYSLGIVVYCLCCGGRTPYSGLSPFQTVGRKLEEARRQRPLALPASVPPHLRQLIHKCTHWDPQQRWSAARAVRFLEACV